MPPNRQLGELAKHLLKMSYCKLVSALLLTLDWNEEGSIRRRSEKHITVATKFHAPTLMVPAITRETIVEPVELTGPRRKHEVSGHLHEVCRRQRRDVQQARSKLPQSFFRPDGDKLRHHAMR
jgi:hypothetical protein